jgi:hypothetical protein
VWAAPGLGFRWPVLISGLPLNTMRPKPRCRDQRRSTTVQRISLRIHRNWLRWHELNVLPLGYEPNELPMLHTAETKKPALVAGFWKFCASLSIARYRHPQQVPRRS